jgi:hypothetical protein
MVAIFDRSVLGPAVAQPEQIKKPLRRQTFEQHIGGER